MDRVALTIDGIKVKVSKGKTVLEAARLAGVYIPALCAHPDLSPYGSCRLCAVEIDGVTGFPSACTTIAGDGMVVHTSTPLVQEIRQYFLGAILKDIPPEERSSPRFKETELGKVAAYIGIPDSIPRYVPRNLPIISDEPLFIRDYNLCIHCGRCVRACQELRGVNALGFITHDGRVEELPVAGSLMESGCKFCGACVEVCPTGALSDKDVKPDEREASLIPCQSACPAGIDAPRYVDLIAQGRFADALAVIREKVPFPATLGYVCFAPCENACRRGALNEPIAIRGLKRFVAEEDTGLWRKRSRVAPATGRKVAVAGSGPAGLTAAYYLAKLGHAVTVFESLPEPGGMMRVGIPEHRLPREILDAEIEDIKRVGVDIRTDTKVESLGRLFEQGYNAVFLAIGAHRGVRMGIEGEESPGVIECVSFLKDINLGVEVKVGDRVAVIGGGNAAIDSARMALRFGATQVAIIYRRSRNEMPASSSEVEEAIKEGVNIIFLAAPSRIGRRNGALSLECLRMKLGKPDASGRRRPIPVKGSQFVMDFDTVIAAIGQTPELPEQLGLPTGQGNTLAVDPDTLATPRDGVFAGGDAVTGPASVIEAIAAGRKAASSIDKYLGGSGIIDETLVKAEEPSPWLGRDGDFASKGQVTMPVLPLDLRMSKCGYIQSLETGWILAEKHGASFADLPVDQVALQFPRCRIGDFPEVELGFDREQAVEEAKRCLKCHLRLRISSVPLPVIKVGGD